MHREVEERLPGQKRSHWSREHHAFGAAVQQTDLRTLLEEAEPRPTFAIMQKPEEGNIAALEAGREARPTVCKATRAGSWESPEVYEKPHRKLSQRVTRPWGTLEKSLTRRQLGLPLSASMKTSVPTVPLPCGKFLSGLCWTF